MENNKNKKSVNFQGDMLNFGDFIHVFVFTRNHHLKLSQWYFKKGKRIKHHLLLEKSQYRINSMYWDR